MKNYADFYCGECNYCVDMFNRRKDNSTKWCSLHNKRADEMGEACQDFVLYEEGEDEMTGDEAKFLFEISTEIPNSYKSVGEAKFGMTIADGARGAVFDVEGVDLINLIDFGSTKAQGDI